MTQNLTGGMDGCHFAGGGVAEASNARHAFLQREVATSRFFHAVKIGSGGVAWIQGSQGSWCRVSSMHLDSQSNIVKII